MRQIILREQMPKAFKSRLAKRILGLGLAILTILLSLSLSLLGLDAYFPPKLDRFHNSSPLLYDSGGALLSVALSKDEYWRIKASIEGVDPLFLKMLIHYEDKRFNYHPGIDPLAMSRAVFQWIKAGRVISGGSTITLQTVRLLEPRKRSISSKLIECLRALQLEAHFSKNEILEMYLSLAPYGGNLEGITAASLSYFGKEPRYLRASEAALLVVMPQLPNHLRAEIYPKRAKRFRDKVIHRLTQQGILTEKAGREAEEEAVPLKKLSFPRYALHVLYGIQNFDMNTNTNTNINTKKNTNTKQIFNPINKSTLNKTLQVQVENLLKSELAFLESTQTVAVLIVENKTRAIRAYVGNADFFDENRRGQVNMVEHVRSPGSTLKPFIYGLGFDDGIIHPETILEDIPTVYGDYAPSNFKDIFHGEVTVREALQQSLNIPAITILDKIKPGRFVAQLENCGVKLHFKRDHIKRDQARASLPIALGGLGITLRDLTSLYVSLGNQGEFLPISLWEKDLKKVPNQDLLSPFATWHINHILEGTFAPEGFVNGNITEGPVIAYKTGTSYGFRDAWAMGYTKDYTIGVWVGKPDGSPSLHQTGRQNAAPILFKLMRFLPTPTERLTSCPEPLNPLSLMPNELPISLRKVEFMKKKKAARGENAFNIQFPKEGMIINAMNGESHAINGVTNEINGETDTLNLDIEPVTLIVKGGKAPFYLMINGKPQTGKFYSSNLKWQPEMLGFHEISVIDSAGHAETITVELR